MFKKRGVLFAAVILPLFFSSCTTIIEIKDKIFEAISSSSDSSKTHDSGTKISVKPSGYKTPDSYDKAYSYRTDKTDKTIQTFIKTKNVDSLRNTNPNEYVKTIVSKINEITQDDFERVKLVHDAICLLVSYDAKNFWANTVPEQDWQNVVKTKTAVCEGYANLFQKFCEELKISSKKVTGYARGVGSDILNENPNDSNHAWNIVQIEGFWYLVDCTWDSGYMKGKSSVQSYTTDWLFLKPEHFIYSHFPDDSRNQLIQTPLSNSAFTSLPDFRPKLFEITQNNFYPSNKINPVDSSIDIEYKLKQGYTLSFSSQAVGGPTIKNRIITEKQETITKTTIQFPSAGKYMITVFYGKEGSNQGQSCGQFIVDAANGSIIQYPTIYPVKSNSAQLLSPKLSPLVAGETVTFEVFCDDRTFVAVIIGRNFIQLENDGTGLFKGEVSIPKNTKQLSIGLSTKKTSSYETLATFEVK